MGNNPPGGWGSFGAATEPSAAEQAFAAWAAERKYEVIQRPDLQFYLSWFPFQYLSRPSSIVHELRGSFGDAKVYVADVNDADPLKQAIGGHRALLVFILSPLLTYRVALRSRSGGGIGAELSRGLNGLESLFGTSPPQGGVLGDVNIDRAFEVLSPSRDEGNWALPNPLRQLLLQNFRGVIEIRPQGMAINFYDHVAFEPRTLDLVLGWASSLYRAAASLP